MDLCIADQILVVLLMLPSFNGFISIYVAQNLSFVLKEKKNTIKLNSHRDHLSFVLLFSDQISKSGDGEKSQNHQGFTARGESSNYCLRLV